MIKGIIFSSMIFVGSYSWATDFNFHQDNYKAAEKASNYLRFDMKSTKLGLVTTGFTGFVKDFTVSADVKDDLVQNTVIRFSAKSMDTDIDGRNEKMWDKCLDSEHHDSISIKITEPLKLNAGEVQVPAVMNIRGKDHPIQIKVSVTQKDGLLAADISAEVSLKALEIPDPSIIVATVNDTVQIKGHLEAK